MDNEVARQSAIGAILERNPNAFRPKVTNSPRESREGRVRNFFGFFVFLDFLEVAFICCQKYETFIYRIQRNYFNLYSLIGLLLPFWELPYLCVVTNSAHQSKLFCFNWSSTSMCQYVKRNRDRYSGLYCHILSVFPYG